jgi:hypothetical protein
MYRGIEVLADHAGTLLFGLSLDWFGGTGRLTAWVVAFGICAIACLVGGIATAFFRAVWGQRALGHAEK